jgi:hypothetical protein
MMMNTARKIVKTYAPAIFPIHQNPAAAKHRMALKMQNAANFATYIGLSRRY